MAGENEEQSSAEVSPEAVEKLLHGEYTHAQVDAVRTAVAEFRVRAPLEETSCRKAFAGLSGGATLARPRATSFS